jgi:hypothetical protein
MGYWHPSILILTLLPIPVLSGMAAEKAAQPGENAAVSYHKAFDAYNSPENGLESRLDQYVRCKGDVSEEIRRHVDNNREALSLALQAANMTKCVWETENLPTKEWSDSLLISSIMTGFNGLENLVLSDARIQFERWNNDECLRRALACYRMAEHAGPTMYLLQLGIESKTNTLIRWVLSQNRLQQGELKLLANRLVFIKKNRQGFLPVFDRDTQRTVEMLSKMTEKYIQQELKSFSQKTIVDPNQSVEIKCTTPTAAEIVQVYSEHRKFLRAIIGKPYREAFGEMQRFKDDVMLQNTQADVENAKMILDGAEVLSSYNHVGFFKALNIDVITRAAFNANESAIGILLEKQRTGKLPDELPKGLPPDPFSGKDFEYKKTESGFVLRCRLEDLESHKTHEYEFNKTDFLK